jgi:RNA polymerase sigma-70 factor (ECF subfamily)
MHPNFTNFSDKSAKSGVTDPCLNPSSSHNPGLDQGQALMEDTLIKQCLKGDREAQTELYHRFASKMFALCYRYANNYHTAQDILQEGFVKVFTHLDMFEGRGSLEGWIRRIMVNTALEVLRKKAPTDRFKELDNVTQVSVKEDMLDKIETQVVMDLIQQIPDGYREVLNLFIIEGYSHQEISVMMGISESNSKIRLMRARTMLQNKIADANYASHDLESQHV